MDLKARARKLREQADAATALLALIKDRMKGLL